MVFTALLTEKLWIIQIFFLLFFLSMDPNLRGSGSLYKGKEGVFKTELEHIRWRAIANPHALKDI